jgi:membrane-bound serine protease (ClpP class)
VKRGAADHSPIFILQEGLLSGWSRASSLTVQISCRFFCALLLLLCCAGFLQLEGSSGSVEPGVDAQGDSAEEAPAAGDEVPAPQPGGASASGEGAASGDPVARAELPADGVVDVYVIPITEAIHKPNLYILRRGLKEAITNNVDLVLLDMDTPGGRVDITIDMMEALARFDGITATYVNNDAISAGSFITAATQEIYFAPDGKIGASAVIMGGGQEVPETAKMKIESYLRANIRVLTEGYPHRSEVIRAMLDAEYELKIGDEVIKPAGELLTLTAKEAVREHGEPPAPLLGLGIHESVEDLLDARFGPGNYVVRDFEITYSERIAKWMNTFAPALLGIGMLLLFFEFKTPGFGVMGIGGLILMGIFFASQHVAGLAGNEAVLFFALGILLILVELFFFPGTLVFALSGLALVCGSLLWAMIDFWPGEPIRFSPELVAEPMVNLVFGMSFAIVGALVFGRMFKGTWFERALVLEEAAGGRGSTLREERKRQLPQPGAEGVAVSDLFPSGRVEVDGQRYEARSGLGPIEHGRRIRVLAQNNFTLTVEAIDS